MDPGNQALQYLLSGITKGSIYAVIAVGFNLIYSATGVLNFAQGEFVMLGGMVAVTLAHFVPLPVAVAGAVVMVALVGCLLEILFFRRLRKHSVLHLIIITIGLSIVMQEVALHFWDEKVRSLPYFTGNEISSVHFFGATISPQVLWVLGTVAAMFLSGHPADYLSQAWQMALHGVGGHLTNRTQVTEFRPFGGEILSVILVGALVALRAATDCPCHRYRMFIAFHRSAPVYLVPKVGEPTVHSSIVKRTGWK